MGTFYPPAASHEKGFLHTTQFPCPCFNVRKALPVPESATWHNLLYVPAAAQAMEEAIGRGTMMLLGLRNFNVSVHMPKPQEQPAVEGAVRVATQQAKGELALQTGQMDAFSKGLAVTRRTSALVTPAAEGDELTISEMRQRKQSILAPLAGVPEAKVLNLKRKEPPATRSGGTGTGDAAAAKERASQEMASQRAKKQRASDVAEAASKAPPKPKRKSPGLPKPKPAKEVGDRGLDLSFLSEESSQ